MAPHVLPLAFAVCFAGLAYVLLWTVRDALTHYDQAYVTDTARQYEDLFLFIPPARLNAVARITALAVFLLFFAITADLGAAAGWLRGLLIGGVMGVAVLFAPGGLLRILRRRRLERFNEQLVEGLQTMSNALRAGYSITQAIESVVKEGRTPIAQEFGMFLQQLRVGVKLADALDQLDKRVGSEDLTLMLLAIETARQSGGNLTEVFDKIAVTIRERLRIKGRVASLTAQGRLQGIVVGTMPFLLLLVLWLLDPVMMQNFYTSPIGLAALGVVILLDLMGFLLIRRIIRIRI